MATNENGSFKQIESDNWSGIYLPAICAGIVMTVVLLLAIACSKKSESSANRISAPPQPSVSAPAPATTAAAIPEAPKKMKKHRPANATYVNTAYGVSFSYPRKYSLAAGKGKPSPVQTSFVKPGSVQIAAVDVPDDSYPETDFSSGLMSVSVNQGMSAEECSQFVPHTSDKDAKPSAVKLGANEFTELEQMSGETLHQTDLKYFHLFKNGACYEFALDVETSRKADEDLAQVDRGQVFKQLEKVLTTARIKDVELPGMEKAEASKTPSDSKAVEATAGVSKATVVEVSKTETPAAATTSTDSKTEKAQVVTPEQK